MCSVPRSMQISQFRSEILDLNIHLRFLFRNSQTTFHLKISIYLAFSLITPFLITYSFEHLPNPISSLYLYICVSVFSSPLCQCCVIDFPPSVMLSAIFFLSSLAALFSHPHSFSAFFPSSISLSLHLSFSLLSFCSRFLFSFFPTFSIFERFQQTYLNSGFLLLRKIKGLSRYRFPDQNRLSLIFEGHKFSISYQKINWHLARD